MELNGLKTERQNRASVDLDKLSALEIATLMNRQDAKVLRAVRNALPEIAKAIDVVHDRLAQGGRLIYVGSGTSGRIGALDASECPPTFGTDPEMIQYVIAGGERALANATEASEDSRDLGMSDMAARKPGKKDVVVGLAASGRTPYTIAALKYAAKKGAATIAVICNTDSELAKIARIAIVADVGPEVLTGSTRLKAGTAQKLICNMLTTGAMARLGYVYGNLMVNLHLKNEKLLERGISTVQRVAKVNRAVALAALNAANMKVSVALVMLRAQVSKTEANRRLKRAQGSIRRAIEGK
ncbi:MAG: N-acetylmuramic acid 6-phosphate etherase [Terracidiphilus sp.]|jgi:N-acetylmuramic acid 6-phosphate etherase